MTFLYTGTADSLNRRRARLMQKWFSVLDMKLSLQEISSTSSQVVKSDDEVDDDAGQSRPNTTKRDVGVVERKRPKGKEAGFKSSNT